MPTLYFLPGHREDEDDQEVPEPILELPPGHPTMPIQTFRVGRLDEVAVARIGAEVAATGGAAVIRISLDAIAPSDARFARRLATETGATVAIAVEDASEAGPDAGG